MTRCAWLAGEASFTDSSSSASPRPIHDREVQTGEQLSFTAFLVHCLARTIEDHPNINAYRDWRGRIVQFDDVDVMVIIEVETDGIRIGVPHVIRVANRRSLQSIHDEIRSVQTDPGERQQPGFASLAFSLPGPVRRLFFRLPQWFPRRWKRFAGTVAVSSAAVKSGIRADSKR